MSDHNQFTTETNRDIATRKVTLRVQCECGTVGTPNADALNQHLREENDPHGAEAMMEALARSWMRGHRLKLDLDDTFQPITGEGATDGATARDDYHPEALQAMRHILGHYGYEGGQQGGSFTTNLLRLWEVADMDNRARLAAAFPAMSVAVDIMGREGGRERIQAILEAQA